MKPLIYPQETILFMMILALIVMFKQFVLRHKLYASVGVKCLNHYYAHKIAKYVAMVSVMITTTTTKRNCMTKTARLQTNSKFYIKIWREKKLKYCELKKEKKVNVSTSISTPPAKSTTWAYFHIIKYSLSIALSQLSSVQSVSES